MSTSQDPSRSSRRALRQEERRERPGTEEIDDSQTAEEPRPSGRRAQAIVTDGVVNFIAPPEPDAETLNHESTADQVETGSAPPWTGPSFGVNARKTGAIGAVAPTTFPFAGWVDAASEGPDRTAIPASNPEFAAASAHVSPNARRASAPEQKMHEPAEDTTARADSYIPVGEPIVDAEPELAEPVAVEQEERTISRREWRAMRAAAEAAAGTKDAPEAEAPAADAPADAAPEAAPLEAERPEEARRSGWIPPLVEPEAAPAPALSDAMSEFEALTRGALPTASSTGNAFPMTLEPEPAAASTPAPASTPAAAPAPAAPTAAVFADTPGPAAEPAEAEPAPYVPPVGHWSRQPELDDDEHVFENTISREVGRGNNAVTTNALVLPSSPHGDDFTSVLNATGEIMVTGTINLPGSLGTTGRDSRRYDDPEVDHLFDAFDQELPSTDSAPVRAITAVSSHTVARGGVESGRKHSNHTLTVLQWTASAMAVGVAGLLTAGFVFDIF